jgi:hypothetical protein
MARPGAGFCSRISAAPTRSLTATCQIEGLSAVGAGGACGYGSELRGVNYLPAPAAIFFTIAITSFRSLSVRLEA